MKKVKSKLIITQEMQKRILKRPGLKKPRDIRTDLVAARIERDDVFIETGWISSPKRIKRLAWWLLDAARYLENKKL